MASARSETKTRRLASSLTCEGKARSMDELTPEELIIQDAEKRIRRILIDLEEATGKRVDHVEVDTRNFVNLHTEITLTK
jgi:hypothetical protein